MKYKVLLVTTREQMESNVKHCTAYTTIICTSFQLILCSVWRNQLVARLHILLLTFATSQNSFAHFVHEQSTEILCFHKCLGNLILLQTCMKMKVCCRNNVFNKTCVTCF